MALSTRKRNLIIADAKAGRFENISGLCKYHKISRKTYYQLEKKHGFKFGENADIVEAAAALSKHIEVTKSKQEKQAIERAVKEKLSVAEMNEKLIRNNRAVALKIQSVLAKKAKNNELYEAKDVKSATSALLDIERIANPKPEILVNNENKQEIKTVEVKFV